MHKVSNNYKSRKIPFKEIYPGEVFSFVREELGAQYYIKNAIGDNLSHATCLFNGNVIEVSGSTRVFVYPDAKFNLN